MYHSTTVANRFIGLAMNKDRRFTHMQIQKLVYIAHGWHLAIYDNPLTSDDIRAWDFGPVYPDLWDALKHFGSQEIRYKIGVFAYNANEMVFGESENELIKLVFDHYGRFHAYQLSALTHKDGTPWHQVYVVDNNYKGKIANAKIKKHFREIAEAPATA